MQIITIKITRFIALIALLALALAVHAESGSDPGATTADAGGEVAAVTGGTVNLDRLEVIGITPVSGADLPLDQIPANVQTVDSEQLQRTQSLNLPEFMSRHLQSVNINDATTNPFQPDVRFRGFTASPLLGLPQGLSVYLNGVRFNEPFGDTVNWDLIPAGAIDVMALHPGSNPVYGLNTLGGAIAIRTKTGFSAPGHQASALGGSWDRHDVELMSGENNGTLGYFIDLRNFGEEGWRDSSNSKVNQGFGAFSWHDYGVELDLTLAGNESDLNGNGAVPVQLHELNPSAVFTHPDNTRTQLFFSSLEGSWAATDEIQVSGNAFYRRNIIKTFNGDNSDYEECGGDDDVGGDDDGDDLAGFVCEQEGGEQKLALDLNGDPIEAKSSVLGATNNFSKTHQENYGGNLQTEFANQLFGHDNQFIVGGGYDRSVINFEFDTELGSLTRTRGTTRSGVVLLEPRVRLHNKVENWGIFFSDTFAVTEEFSLMAAGRYNSTRIVLEDRFGDELNGNHSFSRFNPAGGFTYNPDPLFGLYGRYSESSRAPTPVELSCADPDAPCKLPNAFLADPPLEQVVAKTFEAGIRGRADDLFDGFLEWTAGYYHTTNNNDILFISAGNLTNEGYFDNVGTTRRQGVEFGVNALFDGLIGDFDQWRFGLNYSFIDATFRSPFIASSPNNPSANANGQILVRPGNKLPGIPDHMVKFSTDVDLWQQFSLGFDMLFNSGQYYRGDEANLNEQLAGYVLFNLRAEYRFNEYVALFGKVDNLFDKKYQTFGLYGEPDEVLGPAFTNPRFVGPGGPRAGWIGMRFSLM